MTKKIEPPKTLDELNSFGAHLRQVFPTTGGADDLRPAEGGSYQRHEDGSLTKTDPSVAELRYRWTPENHYGSYEKDMARLDPAWAKIALYFRSDTAPVRFIHKGIGALSVARLAQRLDALRVRAEKGESYSILAAISLCAEQNWPLPEWLALMFMQAMDNHGRGGKFASLDDVFYSTELVGKGQSAKAKKNHAEKIRDDLATGNRLWNECWCKAQNCTEITSLSAVVEAVLEDAVIAGAPYPVKFRTAFEMVKKHDLNQAELLGKREKQPLARFLAKRCKE